jgi:predicted transcriptional regulator
MYQQMLQERVAQLLEWEHASVENIQIWLAAQGLLVSAEEIAGIINKIHKQKMFPQKAETKDFG